MDKLKLEFILAMADKVTRPLKAISNGSSATAKALRAAKDELQALNQAQGKIDAWRKMDKDLAIASNALKGAQERMRDLKQEMIGVESPTKAMVREMQRAHQEVLLLKNRETELITKKEQLRRALHGAGMDTKNLATYQQELRGKIDQATGAVDRQAEALKRENAIVKQMNAARAERDKGLELRNKIAVGGATTMATGAAMGMPVLKAVEDYRTFETAMLGVARQVQGARNELGQLTPIYYEMGAAIQAMAERLPLATNEIAAIVEAGARMGIQGKENLLAFAETTAVMASAFDLPVELIGDQMGKLANLYKIPIQNIGELGDTINYLDDNAQSKGGDIIDVMQRIAGTTTTAGMNFKEAAALGSTFLSLGSSAEVTATATNAIITNLSAATMQSKKFQDGLGMLKLNAKDIQLGMTKDSTGTILKVLEAIKTLPQEKQIEAATRLFGKEFGDDVSKLAGNLEEYRNQLALTKDAQAKGSMGRESDARNQTLDSQIQMAKSALFNLSADLGASLKPTLVSVFSTVAQVASSVRQWAKENPMLAGGIVKIVAGLAMLLTVVGGIMLAVAGVMGPFIMFKFALSSIGIALPGLAGGFGMIGSMIARVGMLLVANPIGIAIMAIAGAAYLIYQNWGPISEWFSAMWARLTTSVSTFMTAIKTGDWQSIGSWIITGIEMGLDAMTMGLYSKVKNIASGLVTTVKETLGIRSPSRIFAELGGFTMAGLEQGIDKGTGGPVGAVAAAAKALTAAGAGILIGGSAMAGDMPMIDTRAPLGQSAPAAPAGGGDSITIHVYAAPGMDEQALARMVEMKLREAQDRNQARRRSSLMDQE